MMTVASPLRSTASIALTTCAAALLATGLFAAGCGDDSTGGSGGGSSNCEPAAGCPAVESDCIAFTDNSAKDSFALRMSHLTVTKPTALTDPTVTNLLTKGITLDYTECKSSDGLSLFTGQGTFNWILEIDKTASTLRTGGAVIETDPTKGYCFVDDTIGGFAVAPLTTNIAIAADGSFEIQDVRDVVVPVFTDVNDPSKVILLPLRGVSIFDAALSTDNNCIGTFNSANLDPGNLCLESTDTPMFIDGASLQGYVTLEDADAVLVPELGNASLCALIAGAQYVDQATKKCQRDANNAIVYQGDWCQGAMEGDPGGPADASCADAMQLQATFAAAGATLRTDCP
ncbi:MAG: hypothetical protein U0271_25200 [Polyangiaceae bacterium]